MVSVFVGRQPIYDRKLRVVAYELLFRSGESNRATFVDGNVATSQVVLNTFLEIGLDHIVGDHRAFLNLTRAFLVEGHAHQFPKDRIVLEVLEGIEADDEVLAAVAALKEAGYTIALDDFVMNDAARPFLPYADIVKVEIPALDEAGIAEHAKILREAGVKQLLAEKVETQAIYDFTREVGFDLFQGYFFAKPTVVEGKGLPPNRLTALQLLARLADPNASLADLEAIIGRDVSLSYKLLRIINSSFYGLPNRVDSIRQAMALLGQRRLRSWVSLIVLSKATEKPTELMVTAMLRARMCELLALEARRHDSDTLFTVGLFSALDALLDAPMVEIVTKLPLSEEVRDALLAGTGPAGRILACVLAYEKAEWDAVACPGVDEATIRKAWLTAVQWADEAAKVVLGES